MMHLIHLSVLLVFGLAIVPDAGSATARDRAQALPQKPSTPATPARPTEELSNEDTHVWKIRLLPKQASVQHRHNHPRAIVVLAGGSVKIVNRAGQAQVLRWETGKAYWLAADPAGDYHSYANDGDRPIEFMYLEFEKSR